MGHDLTIIRPVGSPNGWDDDGNQIIGQPSTQAVRGLLMPASTRQRAAAASAGQGLPVPGYVAYVPFDAVDLDTPGWHLQHGGENYYPLRDAQDIGGQGICWLIELGSPGEVIQRG
ncbi:hypothetical protein [Deinococcus sp. SL84]|uniref:hypothetical protein n=1 Tax=Deinococcus sp. SL84 TaxID=2994663 RepID=UPI0022765DB8|nr:hypothetical protein [Deinococcus sp. SL84]MCY1703639.1 hypothetical protein [Deinococcus sp. SL84]